MASEMGKKDGRQAPRSANPRPPPQKRGAPSPRHGARGHSGHGEAGYGGGGYPPSAYQSPFHSASPYQQGSYDYDDYA